MLERQQKIFACRYTLTIRIIKRFHPRYIKYQYIVQNRFRLFQYFGCNSDENISMFSSSVTMERIYTIYQ